MQGHEARQRGLPLATTTAEGQMPGNNGHRVPQTPEACRTDDEPGHGRRCQGKLGPHARTPHPQPVGSGPEPHAPRTGGGVWESAPPRTPHTQVRGAALQAASGRPHSAQRQLARARAAGLVTGPRAQPPHPQPVGTGPGRTPQGRAVCRGKAPNPGSPTPRQEPPLPPGRPHATPTARKASSHERMLGGW